MAYNSFVFAKIQNNWDWMKRTTIQSAYKDWKKSKAKLSVATISNSLKRNTFFTSLLSNTFQTIFLFKLYYSIFNQPTQSSHNLYFFFFVCRCVAHVFHFSFVFCFGLYFCLFFQKLICRFSHILRVMKLEAHKCLSDKCSPRRFSSFLFIRLFSLHHVRYLWLYPRSK